MEKLFLGVIRTLVFHGGFVASQALHRLVIMAAVEVAVVGVIYERRF